jgi:hypothetical protein
MWLEWYQYKEESQSNNLPLFVLGEVHVLVLSVVAVCELCGRSTVPGIS